MSDTKPTATLGGKPLLGSSAVQWTLQEGTKPVIETFDMAPDDAKQIATSKEVDLVINVGAGNPLRVQKLSVLNISPGENPFISKVTVADRRWRWSYCHVIRRYNMRRNVGVKRIQANDQIAVSFDRAPQVAYWDWSQNNGVPWSAREGLEDVLERIQDFEQENGVSKFTFKIDERLSSKLKPMPFEEVILDDAGDSALDRLLRKFQEARLYVDYDGNVVIYSKASGGESELVRALLPEFQDRGHVDLVKNNLIRPSKIEVLFTREVEVRFDFIENASASSTQTADDDVRRMDNVLPTPDYQLTVSGRTIPQGTYITFDEAFNAWGSIPLIGNSITMDHDLIQRAFIPHMDLWAALQISGDFVDPQSTLADWIGRISTCQTHYRQTFRIKRKWTDRIYSIRPYRLATIDPQSGQRGPLQAWGDYCILPTQRAIWRRTGQKSLPYAFNQTAYPSSGNLDSTAKPSPAVVSILDHDQGIIRVDYVLDPYRQREMILPSQMVANTIPLADLRQRSVTISFDAIINQATAPKLSPSFKLATIVTAIPASPNTEQQLHKITINPSDIADLLPNPQAAALNECNGPIMQIRIGANTEVARIQWLDARATDIEKIFGVTEGEPNLDGLVLNQGNKTNLETGASLNAIAKAVAASYYASLVDRYEGTMTGHLNGQIKMNGWVDQISHRLETDGTATTSIDMADDLPQFDLMAFLDSSTRAAILHPVPEKI